MINIVKAFLNLLLDIYRSFYCYKKISHIFSLNKKKYNSIDKRKAKEHRNFWKPLKRFHLSDKWYKVYSTLCNNPDIRYVPENIFYTMIQSRLNNEMFNLAYSDKNFYDEYFGEKIFPLTILRNIYGIFYNKDYDRIVINNNDDLFKFVSNHNKIIIKPAIDSSGGNKVSLFEKEDNNYINTDYHILTIEYLKKNYDNNFIVQEFIAQHSYFKQFNSTSLNTVRMLTYRSVRTEEIKILSAVIRMGVKSNIVDNFASGGIALGVNEDGSLNNYAFDKFAKKYYQNYNKSLLFKNISYLYRFDDLKYFAMKIAKKYRYHRMLGLDLSIDINDNIRIIEINLANHEINFFQFTNGPLFKEYTDEVIEYCLREPKTICLDFNL